MNKFKAGDKAIVGPSEKFYCGQTVTLVNLYTIDDRPAWIVETEKSGQVPFFEKDLAPISSPTSKFKVGDRVRLKDGSRKPGVVNQLGDYSARPYVWFTRDDKVVDCQYEDLLDLISSPTSAFKVGDRVMVTGHWHEFWNGTIGVIKCFDLEYFPAKAVIKPENRPGHDELRFATVHLSKQILLSPPSPQPQTTEPKEDTMKPYAVIYHNLNAGVTAQIQSQHTTEEEAKESAELLIAGERANKRYFAVTIVNTKTGKLVGSVVDAPPAVDWKTE